MRKLSTGLLFSAICISSSLHAQSIDAGKKFLYYERYKSAQDVFEKLLAANPNNIDAVYWLGETMMHNKNSRDTAGAKALYTKMLASNGNAPSLLAGMGHVDLMYGDTVDAKTKFETASSLTKDKDVNVLNAIGYANVDARAGNANYAIAKLTTATATKKFNNAMTYVYLGDAYRKLLDGGNAVTNYTKALELDPKLAEAKMKIGIVYLTQNNREYFLPAFDEATTIDPAYAPAYQQLLLYWYQRDVNKAAAYTDKYLANSDQGPESEYVKTDMLYAQGKIPDAKAKALTLITQFGDKVNPRMYRMIAYANDTLGDLAGARDYMQTFLAKSDTADIRGTDYEEMAKIYSKQTDTVTKDSAFDFYMKAIAKDTLAENKTRYVAAGLKLADSLKNKTAGAQLALLRYNSIKEPVNSDLYAFGYANYSAGNYKTADSIFCGLYESKFPNEIYGYLWCAKSKQAEDDSTNSGGLAVDAYDKLASFARASADSVKYKPQTIQAYYYLASYYNDIKKDKPKAIEYMKKVIEVDPTNDSAPKVIKLLEAKPKAAAPASKPKAGAKTGAKK